MKLGGWVMMLFSLILFLTLMGIPTGLTNILDTFGFGVSDDGDINSDIENSTFWTWVIGGLAVIGVGGGVIIGLFAKGYDPSLIYAPIIVLIGGLFGSTFWSVIKLVSSYEQVWMTYIVALIFGSLSIGFIMACFDYFGGR